MLAVLCLASLALPAHDVHVVDDDAGPSTEFATIADAIAAAAEGDTVLVRPGTYASFQLTGLGIDVVGVEEQGLRPVVEGVEIRVQGLGSAQAAVIRDLDVATSLRVEGCAGPVLIEGVRRVAASKAYLNVSGCDDVVLVRCVFDGHTASVAGARVSQSSVHVYESTFRGGDYAWPGLDLDSSFAFLSDSIAFGGPGIPGADGGFPFEWCFDGGAGGPGLELSGSSCTALDSSLVGGSGGPPGEPVPLSGFPPCDVGPKGPDVSGSGLVELPGVARGFHVTSPGVEGGSITLTAHGLSGEVVYVFVGAKPAPQWFPPWTGTLTVSISSPLLLAGVVPPAGPLSLNVGVGPLAAGLEGVSLVAQPVFVAPGGGVVLGSPSALELLDAGVL